MKNPNAELFYGSEAFVFNSQTLIVLITPITLITPIVPMTSITPIAPK